MGDLHCACLDQGLHLRKQLSLPCLGQQVGYRPDWFSCPSVNTTVTVPVSPTIMSLNLPNNFSSCSLCSSKVLSLDFSQSWLTTSSASTTLSTLASGVFHYFNELMCTTLRLDHLFGTEISYVRGLIFLMTSYGPSHRSSSLPGVLTKTN